MSPKKRRPPKVEDATPTPLPAPVTQIVEPKQTEAKKVAPERRETIDLISGVKRVRKPVEEAPVKEEKPTPQVQNSVESPAPAADAMQSEIEGDKVLQVKPPITVAELAAAMNDKPHRIIKDLMGMGFFCNATSMVDADTIARLAPLHGFVFEREKREKGAGVKKPPVEVIVEPEPVAVEEEPQDVLRERTPIITVMGHVDHGKTSLLDYIRKTSVVKGEAGGITQHIGAYSVEHGGHKLTFLDTPGHAIFTEMRARGADVTDIVVVVVAADDGLMPQTRESIRHAKASGKAMIIAINKCDLPNADPDRAKTSLMQEEVVVTDLGGDVECVEISALKGHGVDVLLDLLALQSEVLELRANPRANCRATIIEAKVEQGKGSSATAIVESGTLKIGMPFICGPYAGKVRQMTNDRGERVKQVVPGMPVEVTGFSETPNVGDALVQMESEKDAKKLAEERQLELRQQRLTSGGKKVRLEDMMRNMGTGDTKAQLKLYLKGDVQGSVEAIRKAIESIDSDKVECVFIHSSAGPISESDVIMSSSSDSIILGFNVKVEANAVKVIKREGVQVKLYSIVYELIDQVRDAMLGLLAPETRETIIGHAEIRQVFKLNKGRAGGAFVIDGKVIRSCEARVMRDGQAVFDGKMSTLRRFQDEVDEVKGGLECGIRLGEFNEYEVGDVIECYTLEKIKQSL